MPDFIEGLLSALTPEDMLSMSANKSCFRKQHKQTKFLGCASQHCHDVVSAVLVLRNIMLKIHHLLRATRFCLLTTFWI